MNNADALEELRKQGILSKLSRTDINAILYCFNEIRNDHLLK